MSSHLSSSRITPMLWFDGNAEQAVAFYLSVFANSRRINEMRNSGPAPGPKDRVLTISFELEGQAFIALNGGPMYKFTEAISWVVLCDSLQEIDAYWEKLTAGGGSEIQCGWLKDKFGMCWQVTPRRMPDLIRHPKALAAMMGMKKLDIAALEAAAGTAGGDSIPSARD